MDRIAMFQAGARAQQHLQLSAQAAAEIAFVHKRTENEGVFLSGLFGDAWRQCLDVPSALAELVIDAPPPEAPQYRGDPVATMPSPLSPRAPLASEPLTVALPSGCVAGDSDPLDGGFAAGEPATVLATWAIEPLSGAIPDDQVAGTIGETEPDIEENPCITPAQFAAALNVGGLEDPPPLLGGRAGAATIDETDPSVEENPCITPAQIATVFNEGSLGHPFCCSRPCMFFASGTCANAAGCSYCHLPHLKRPVHLDKQNRAYFDGMHPRCRVGLLLSLLRKKVTSAGLMTHVEASFDGLASACGACDTAEVPPSCRATCKKSDRALRSALSGMAIRPLLTMLERTVGLGAPDAASAIEAFWNECRAGFEPGSLAATPL